MIRALVFQAREEIDESNRTAYGILAIVDDVDEDLMERVRVDLGHGLYQIVIERLEGEVWRFEDASVVRVSR